MKTLKEGSRGDEVKLIQKSLHLIEDGIFGEITTEAVKEFQKANGLEADGIVGEKTWAKLQEGGLFLRRTTNRKINKLIVHCTATPEGKECTVDEIRQWHIARKFADIGYHYVINLAGKLLQGRSVDKVGAHTRGHNVNSIGIVYVGGYAKDGKTEKDTRTEAQKKTLRELLMELKRMYPNATIHGHKEFANKACPCFDAKEEYADI